MLLRKNLHRRDRRHNVLQLVAESKDESSTVVARDGSTQIVFTEVCDSVQDTTPHLPSKWSPTLCLGVTIVVNVRALR